MIMKDVEKKDIEGVSSSSPAKSKQDENTDSSTSSTPDKSKKKKRRSSASATTTTTTKNDSPVQNSSSESATPTPPIPISPHNSKYLITSDSVSQSNSSPGITSPFKNDNTLAAVFSNAINQLKQEFSGMDLDDSKSSDSEKKADGEQDANPVDYKKSRRFSRREKPSDEGKKPRKKSFDASTTTSTSTTDSILPKGKRFIKSKFRKSMTFSPPPNDD
eukprot:TRINITY_DN689_c1_g1_i7.p2 TRINITY_DN689_c1_g1~~TRINITY_DN689_c1_g1_i7.p2  ORF type:complete len:218 (-),score=93.99 TRINITY_DN689_c1_g1_i7:178-831(-)